ncbi:hypothetical protein GU700_22370 [Methylobacterium sp. NI91]|nr:MULTISPECIES: hypothetical protein [unclassified Methylobacterium]QIJ77071.1 hypothetical protein CLZ_22375 [Methylobacterium sp. CLZ]QIJ81975.1 hypothetical protein GU700_22370 [Methylobacterium sp. NI91]
MPRAERLGEAEQVFVRILHEALPQPDLAPPRTIPSLVRGLEQRPTHPLQTGEDRGERGHFDLKIGAAAERMRQRSSLPPPVDRLQHDLRSLALEIDEPALRTRVDDAESQGAAPEA